MSKRKVNKKPTIKEITSVLFELNDRINSMGKYIGELEKAFSLYVEMNKDDIKFTKYIDEKIKKWKKTQDDAKENGDPDKPNLQGDTDGEKSGAKRVREKAK
jgi:hypothetical protein